MPMLGEPAAGRAWSPEELVVVLRRGITKTVHVAALALAVGVVCRGDQITRHIAYTAFRVAQAEMAALGF